MKIKYPVQEASTKLGITTLRKFQIKPINSILDGHDTLVIAPTSSGKSAIYQILAIMNSKEGEWTLVIEPTIALIADQVNKLQELGVPAEMLTSRNRGKHDAIRAKLWKKQIAILYVTPEQLPSFTIRELGRYRPPRLVVVDEAHCVLDWGYTFRQSYLWIKDYIKEWKRCPVITAFTATAPPEYRDAICEHLGMKEPNIYASSLERNNITLLKEDLSDINPKQILKKRLSRTNYNIKKYGKDGRVVVYCATRSNVDMVCNYLSKKFPGEVVKCHAYMDTEKREKHEMQFIKGSKPIMVATTAFGMGIDVPDIRLVIHFNLPLNAIDYYQQVGRSGRDGKKSRAVLLYHPDDIELNRYILNKDDLSETVCIWQNDRLYELVSIIESDRCLMQQVLEALGEDHPKTCRHCTACQRARR